MRDKSAEQTLDTVLNFMGAFGTPYQMITDKGQEFNNRQFKRQMDELDVEIHFTTVGHPRSQGVIERLPNLLMEHLHLINVGQGGGIKLAMGQALIAYNNTIHKATWYKPLETVFGENFGRRGATLTESNPFIGKFRKARKREMTCTNAKVKSKLKNEKVKGRRK